MTYYGGGQGGSYDSSARRKGLSPPSSLRFHQAAQVAKGEFDWDTFARLLEIIDGELGTNAARSPITVVDEDSTFSDRLNEARDRVGKRGTRLVSVRAMAVDDSTKTVAVLDYKRSGGGITSLRTEGPVRKDVYGLQEIVRTEIARGRVPGTDSSAVILFDAIEELVPSTTRRPQFVRIGVGLGVLVAIPLFTALTGQGWDTVVAAIGFGVIGSLIAYFLVGLLDR